MSFIRVGVLRGGPSTEHEVSLKTGENVLASLPSKYAGHDIFISKDGEWFLDGFSSVPERIFRNIDVALNAMHGQFGEDGKVQQILETFGVPYTGSDVMASAIGMNKVFSRESFKRAGLLVPYGFVVEGGKDPEELSRGVFNKLGPAWVIKPLSGGSSVGVSVVHNRGELADAIAKALEYDNKVLVEQFISGTEATCGVIDKFRNQNVYALPVVEIIPADTSNFFDYHAKYSGASKEICPAGFSVPVKRQIEEMAKRAHESIGARHYSRTDFIVAPNGKIYVLEINTLPGLTSESLLPKAVKVIGSSYPQFLDHILTLALNK